MTLKMIEKKEKEFDGRHVVRTEYEIGEYEIVVHESFYPDGDYRRSIDCSTSIVGRSFFPDIYYRSSWSGEEPSGFEIQTTSYGALAADEFRSFLAAQQMALEVVEVLSRELGKEEDHVKREVL